jgi:hypothetical protein
VSRERDIGRVEEPDVEIGAAASAKRLRFKRKPRVEVDTHAYREVDPELAREMEKIEGEGYSNTERENLPEEVEPGVTYRDVRVRWRAAARLEGAEPPTEREREDGRREAQS